MPTSSRDQATIGSDHQDLGPVSTVDGDSLIVQATRFLNALLFLLVAGIGGQTVLAVNRARQASPPPAAASAVVVGDTLLTLTGNHGGEVPTTIRLATDASIATVLYVFHPDCVHCHTVAPDWADHFSEDRDNGHTLRRVAVTNDSVNPAVAYAERFRWNVEVLSVQELRPGSREYSLLYRTPWIFVFDSIGVLRYEGHGSRLDDMMQAVSAL